MTKPKLKTFWEILARVHKNCTDPHEAFRGATGDTFDAHHAYLLHLEERIEKLETLLPPKE